MPREDIYRNRKRETERGRGEGAERETEGRRGTRHIGGLASIESERERGREGEREIEGEGGREKEREREQERGRERESRHTQGQREGDRKTETERREGDRKKQTDTQRGKVGCSLSGTIARPQATEPAGRVWLESRPGSRHVWSHGIKDPVPLTEKSRRLSPGGRFPPSFIHQVITITGLIEL